MPDETVRVQIMEVAKFGKAWKIQGKDGAGAVRTYTMHENDRDTGQLTIPPECGENVLLVYGTQTGEYQGKQQTTYWVNEVRMMQANGDAPAPPPQQTAEPKKPPQTSSFENPMNASIEWQVCVKEAAATLRANQGWAKGNPPITGSEIAAMARDIFYGKEIPTHGEANQEQGDPEPEYTG